MKPSCGHKSYRIQYTDARGRWKTYRTEEIDAINLMFKRGISSEDMTLSKMKAILDGLYKSRDRSKPISVYHSDNHKIAERYIADRYSTRRARKVEPSTVVSARYDISRAVMALGNVSLNSPIEDIDMALEANIGADRNKFRRVSMRINSILRWLGRTDRVIPPSSDWSSDIPYITEDELKILVSHTEDELSRLAYQIAFYTGLRIGELFGLQVQDVHKESSFLYVNKQMLEKTKEIKHRTKGKKPRKVPVPEHVFPILDQWFEIDESKRRKARGRSWAKVLRDKGINHLGKMDLTFHSLRHSAAIWALSKNLPLAYVAKMLGNSQSVAERYYTGKTASDSEVEAIASLLNK